MGRPRYVLPENFNKVANSYINREITCNEAAKNLIWQGSTFLKYVKQKEFLLTPTA